MEELKPRPANSPPQTPLGFLDRAATVYGDCTSIVYGEKTYTWRETQERCLRVASSIRAMGIGRGDVVSVIAPNVPAMYELHFAVPMSGAVLNNLNTRLDARTLSVLLRHCSSRLLFAHQDSADLALAALADVSPRPQLVLISDDAGDGYERMVESGDPRFDWIRPESEWDPIVLNYTSGTTSSPKGVVHCHRGIFAMTMDSLVEWGVPKQAVYLWTLPMFHANGWSYPWGIAAVGGTNVCLLKFDAAAVFAAIKRHGVTHMCGAPVVLNMLANGGGALGRAVEVMTAGAPPPAEVLARAEALGFVVSHGYGLTETAGLVVSCAWKRGWDRLSPEERARMKARQGVGTVGLARAAVVDQETGKEVAHDGVSLGEVVLRGGSVMLGYYKDKEGTALCMRPDGWFYTGDVAVVHPDGYMEIKDRSKDVIISGGENISSVEVESAIYGFPGVDEAAVVARPDDFWGEAPCAFVTLKDTAGSGGSTEEEIIKFCREKLPHFMVPRTVVVRDELPRTSTGKIQKFVLREMARKMGPTSHRRSRV